MAPSAVAEVQDYRRVLRRQTIARAVRMRPFYVLAALSMGLLLLFKYVPIYGVVIAFKDFSVHRGWLGSPWNDFKHFRWLFQDPFFTRVLFNTFWISTLRLAFAFPAPIIMALMLNEIRSPLYKRGVQTISYLPHFISWVILGGIFAEMFSVKRGPIAFLFETVGLEPIGFLVYQPTFRGVLVVTGIWKSVGWGTIVYLAGMAGVDPTLYESAEIDGANRWQKAVRITLPSIIPVITIVFLLDVGNILEESFDQIFNLANSSVLPVADVFDTYIYRSGIVDGRYDYTTAVGLFKNVAGLAILVVVNSVIRRYTEYGVW